MVDAAWQRRAFNAAVTFLALCMALVALRPLLPVDETRYLTVAWEMRTGNSYIVPHLNAEVYSHKPPLLFWLINLTWTVVGVVEWSARLVGPVAGAICVYLTAVLSSRLWPEQVGRAGDSAWVLASTGVFVLFGSLVMFDTLLTMDTLLALLALWTLAMRPGWRPVVALGAALALGGLAKGPVILLHVMPVALAQPLWRSAEMPLTAGQWYARLGLALGLGLALIALWLGPALVLGDAAYRQDILWRQSSGRMVNAFAHQRHALFFVLLLPAFLWPWGWINGWRFRGLAAWLRSTDAATRFVLIWVGATFVLFSLISGKQMHYLLPLLPGLALLLTPRARIAAPGWLRALWALPLILALLVAVLINQQVLPVRLPPGAAIDARALMAVALCALLGGLALWRLRHGLAPRVVLVSLTLLAFHLLGQQTMAQQYNPAHLAAMIAPHAQHGVATTDGRYAGQFSFAARLPTPVRVLRDTTQLEDWIAGKPGSLILSRQALSHPQLGLLGAQDFHSKTWFVYRVRSNDD